MTFTAADVNCDGNVDITDYTMLRFHILGIDPIENTPQEGELVSEPVTVDFTIDMHEFDDGRTAHSKPSHAISGCSWWKRPIPAGTSITGAMATASA